MTFPDPHEPDRERRTSPLLPAATLVTPHRRTPVPSPAHPTHRAIRELRSPR